MEDTYDVIVVGAGPAGATAAYFLREAGKKVLVLEKETLPRYKTCGGGISVAFLESVFPFSFDPVLDDSLSEMTYSYKRFSIDIPVEKGVVGMVMRDRFDAYILENARAEVRQGCMVKAVHEHASGVIVETQDGAKFSARYLIGADGANSRVARSLGLRQRKTMAAAIEVEVPASPEALRSFANRAEFIFGEMRYGYLWVFPKNGHLSVGIAALKPRPGELQRKLKKAMERRGISLEGLQLHGHPIPFYVRREAITTQRSLLAGDAAGLVDPLSGEGIRYAIKSGRLAAEAVLAQDLSQYAAQVQRRIGWNHSFARPVALIFYHLQPLCLALGAPNPFTTRVIVDLLSDRAASAEVMLLSILTLPVFAITEIAAGIAHIFAGPAGSQRIRRAVYFQGRF